MTRDGVYLKESLFLVLLCGEASQVYVKVRKLLRLTGGGALVCLGSESAIPGRFGGVAVLFGRSMAPLMFEL